MATANTIESFFALIKPSAGSPARALRAARGTTDAAAGATFNATLKVLRGATLRLPADRHVSVLAGHLWLTHRGDSRDHFPRGGDSFDTSAHSDSVIQALADSTLLIQ